MTSDPLDVFGLDPFQKIVVSDLLRDLEGFEWPPTPDSEHERMLMQIGAVVLSVPTAAGGETR